MNKRTPNFARILAVVAQRQERASADSAYRTRASESDELGADEAEAIVAIAFHMVNADGEITGEERGAFDALVDHLGAKTDKASLRSLVARLATSATKSEASIEENVRVFAAMLKRPVARETAYKAAYALRVWDLDASPDEDELDEILIEALGFSDELASDLASEVNEALVAE